MEKNKRMQFYGGTLGACAPLLQKKTKRNLNRRSWTA